ncbi:MAG TPA: tetratricopeptide repeat protein [Terriglobales bacterium]|nr:tetratricopeptide repeat protein [Terriglobales bacterium]
MRNLRSQFVILLALLSGVAMRGQSGGAAFTAHVGKGYDLVQNDRYAEAAQEFRAALELDPDAVQARYQLAVCLFALGERDESRKELVRVRSSTHGDPKVIYYLGRLDLLGGDPDGAIRNLRSIMQDPPFADAAFYLGSAYLDKRDPKNAMEWLRKAVHDDPRDFRSHYRLARALQQEGLQQKAEEEYALSTQLRERYNEASRQSVACVQALHSQAIEQAREICNHLFDRNDPDRLTSLGILYGENGEYQEAIEPLKRAAELDPDSFEIYHNLGLSYFRLRRYSEARAPLEKAVGLRPNFFGSNALLGATLYSLQDDEAAYRVLDFAHRLNPGDQDTSELLFRVSAILGEKLAAAGQYEGSLKLLEKAAALRPENLELQRRITDIRNRLGPMR